MKILHIVSNLSIRSGVMSVLMNYYRNMDTKKFIFDFLYFDEREITYKNEIKALGGSYHRIKREKNLLRFVKAIRNFLKMHAKEYDVLHLHEVYLTGFLLGLRRQIGIDNIVVHAHATRFSDHRLGEFRNRIMAIPNKNIPDYYFACSREAGTTIYGKSFTKKGRVINNAIDLNKFHKNDMIRMEYREALKLNERFVIGHVGNFSAPKNHFFIIDIFYEILKQEKDAALVLVGDGERKERVMKKCSILGISDRVKFLGARNDVNKIMNAFDCFLFPSIFEGLGIVLIEAQATGIPCVFSSVIPREANILNSNNRIMSLNDASSAWASAVLESKKLSGIDVSSTIRKAGYDIALEAGKLEEIYLNM